MACALFARLRGGEVAVVDSRPERLAVCREQLGIPHALELARLAGEARGHHRGEMFDVAFDATGNAKAMETGFQYIAHGGTDVLVSVVSADIRFSDPDFHRREITLMGSRNATVEDFHQVLEAMRAGRIPSDALQTHRASLREFASALDTWIRPETGVIKAIVDC